MKDYIGVLEAVRIGRAIMVKVVVSKVRPAKRASRRSPISKTRVRDLSGQYRDVFTIDSNSPTFEGDLTHVFRENVAEARRENTRLFGSPDGLAKTVRQLKSLNADREK